MGKYSVPAAMVAALVALAAAAGTLAFVPEHPTWWPAARDLAILGGITPMIAAVNIRIVPVFSRRKWAGEGWLRAQLAAMVAGGWLVWFARLADGRALLIVGHTVALAGGLLFMANIVRLFRQPAGATPALPLPFPNQADADRVAIACTRFSGLMLQVGLLIGLVLSLHTPRTGRWDLVWAHAMLVGFLLSMAAGVCYHVLSRWTMRPWRAVWPMRAHLWATLAGVPLMLVALAAGWERLFLVAGPLQAAALALFVGTVLPQIAALPGLTRPALAGAAAMLAAGVALGAAFAIDPALGARWRLVHAELNLFGFAGLLIVGASDYLVPRFAGAPLRWPRLATLRLALLGGGVVAGAAAFGLRSAGHDAGALTVGAQAAVAGGFLLGAAVLAGTFQAGLTKPPAVTVSPVMLTRRHGMPGPGRAVPVAPPMVPPGRRPS